MLFLDNDASKFALLKGSSDNSVVDVLAGLLAETEATVHSFTWLARVPSKSNIADPPSGNGVSAAFFQSALNVSDKAEDLLSRLLTKIEECGVNGFVSSQPEKDSSSA